MLLIVGVLTIICATIYRRGILFFLFWILLCAVGIFFFVIYPEIPISVRLFKSYYIVYGALSLFAYIFAAGFHNGATLDSPSSRKSHNANSTDCEQDEIFADGTRRTPNISRSGYYYTNGITSWVDALGYEHRSNGEVVKPYPYYSDRWEIYTESGRYLGYEYRGAMGIIHRVNE